MIQRVREWLTMLLSGKDNYSPDATKIIAIIYGLGGLLFQGWEVIVKSSAFDMERFGLGAAAYFAAVGAALGFKKDDPEPGDKG